MTIPVLKISAMTNSLTDITIAGADKLVVLDASKVGVTDAEATAVILWSDVLLAIAAALAVTGNNMIIGSGVPGAGVGADGDLYVDSASANYDVYGPKAGGAWGAISGTLRGPSGLGDRQVVASVAGVLTIDYNAGQWVDVALAENITSIVVTNWPASGTLGRLTIRYTLGAGGPYTVAHGTVAATTYKEDGALPTITATEGNKTTVQIISSDALATADVIVGASNLAIA